MLTDVADQIRFLLVEEVEIDPDSWVKVMDAESAKVLDAAIERLTSLDMFEHEQIEASLRAMLEDLGLNARKGLQPLRVAITGSTVSPPLFESMAVLGQEAVLSRLRAARARL